MERARPEGKEPQGRCASVSVFARPVRLFLSVALLTLRPFSFSLPPPAFPSGRRAQASEQKKLSKKINYKAFQNLFAEASAVGDASAKKQKTPSSAAAAPLAGGRTAAASSSSSKSRVGV